jgi:hypothetical protein
MPRSPLKPLKVLEEHVASIFRVEEYAKQESSMKKVARLACVDVPALLASFFMLVCCLAYFWAQNFETFHPKYQLTFTGLHVVSKTTAVRTSNRKWRLT